MHVKSLEQNRPACIMERNTVREARRAVSGLAPPPHPGAERRRCQGPKRAREGEIRGRPVTLLTDTTCMDGELTCNGMQWRKTRRSGRNAA